MNKMKKTIIGVLAGLVLLSGAVNAMAALITVSTGSLDATFLGGVSFYNFNNAAGNEVTIGPYTGGVIAGESKSLIKTTGKKEADASWKKNKINSTTFSYDATSLSAFIKAPGAAPLNISTNNDNAPSPTPDYLQINVTGSPNGTLTYKNVTLNGILLPVTNAFAAVNTSITQSWNVTGFNFSSGFLLAGDIVFTGKQSADSRIEILLGSQSSSPTPIPIPAAVWLLGSGLLGLGILRKYRDTSRIYS